MVTGTAPERVREATYLQAQALYDSGNYTVARVFVPGAGGLQRFG